MEHVLIVGTPRPSPGTIDAKMNENNFTDLFDAYQQEQEQHDIQEEQREQEEDLLLNSNTTAYLEARLGPDASISTEKCVKEVENWMRINVGSLSADSTFRNFNGSPILQKNIELIRVAEIIGSTGEHHTVASLHLTVRAYKLYSDSSSVDVNTGDNNTEDDAAVARTFRMPSAHLEGLWESLYFDTDIKSVLLQFMSSAILFGEKGIDYNFISWNRLIFLHGPPGTGKTSLCRSLAQKIAIRMNHRYEYTKLVEINSHSLFSRYFSESGKLVGKTFEDFLEMLEDDDTFLVVLIDEVESLTTARTAAASGNDPSDSLRAVNALLTGLDKLKYKDNVIVLTTSNLPHTVDPAFLDRIDFRYCIGPPGAKSIYTILRSMFEELIRCNIIIHTKSIPTVDEAYLTIYSQPEAAGSRLYQCATRLSEKSSGRSVKRLPLLMHAKYIQKATCTLEEAVGALERQIEDGEREEI